MALLFSSIFWETEPTSNLSVVIIFQTKFYISKILYKKKWFSTNIRQDNIKIPIDRLYDEPHFYFIIYFLFKFFLYTIFNKKLAFKRVSMEFLAELFFR